jgi:hypothetical protein
MFSGSLPERFELVIVRYYLDDLIVAMACGLFGYSLYRMRQSQLSRNEFIVMWKGIAKEEQAAFVSPTTAAQPATDMEKGPYQLRSSNRLPD